MAQIASLTLYHNDDARPIIEAILADNPGVRVLEHAGLREARLATGSW